MKLVVVGIADGTVSGDRDAVLVTYALGSCIAVAVHDPLAGVAGLAHYMLPDSNLDTAKAAGRPWMFADTAIPRLLDAVLAAGAGKRRLRVYLAGGAQVMDPNGVFEIGKRNYLAARKLLWKAGLLVSTEAVGGTESRTIRLEVASGKVLLRDGGEPERVM